MTASIDARLPGLRLPGPRGRLSWIGLLCLLLVLSGCATREERRVEHKRLAWEFHEEGNYEKARVEFLNALQIEANDADARYGAALSFRGLAEHSPGLPLADRQNHLRTAAGHLLAAVEVDPSHVASRVEFADLRLQVFRDVRGALEMAEEALRLDPRHPGALAKRGAANQLLGNTDQAWADIDRALAIDRYNPDAIAVRAAQLSNRDDTESAVELLREAVRAGDEGGELRLLLANLYVSLNRADEAVEALREVLRAQPDSNPLRLNLAALLTRLERLNEAEKVLRDGADRESESNQMKLALVDFLGQLRDPALARSELEGMVQRAPDDYELRLALAQLYFNVEQFALGERTLRELVDAAGEDSSTAVRSRLLLAERLIVAERDGEARELIDAVLEASPRDTDALRLRGLMQLQEGNYTMAVGDLRAALRLDPASTDILRPLATAFYQNGEQQLARETLAQAVEVDPRNFEVRLMMARLALEQEDADTAIEALQAALEIDPRSFAALDLLVGLSIRAGEIDEAREAAQNFVNDNPEDPRGYYLAGLAAGRDGDAAQSEALLREAVQRSPESGEPLAMLVQLLMQQERAADAKALLDPLVEQGVVAARSMRARLHVAEQEFDQARSIYEQLREESPDWAAPYRGLALVASGESGVEAAVDVMSAGWQRSNDAALGLDYALLLQRLGRGREAVPVYEQMLAANPDNGVAANNLAMLLIDGDPQPRALDRAIELVSRFRDSSNGAFIDTLGWAYVKKQQPGRAVPLLQRAVELAPGLGVIRYHLAEALFLNGDPDGARQALQEALRGDVQGEWVEPARALLERLGQS